MVIESGNANSMTETSAECPVCARSDTREFLEIDQLQYWRCEGCGATFLDARHRLSAPDECAQYLLHENGSGDPQYRKFLNRLAAPLLDKIGPGQTGLDFGCGPVPVLAKMLEEAGHHMRHYDPFFHDDTDALNQRYDFIVASETVEHFYDPAMEFERLDAGLKPGGWLAVMTCFQTDDARFANWHYRRDPTHVVFYRESTFEVIAGKYAWSCFFPAKDIALMQKPVSSVTAS